MIKRIAVLAILGLAPLALLLLPSFRERFTTAEVTVAVAAQPREEVLILGFIKSFDAQPFSIQTLRIEEPGKEPYRRLVSLDANQTFELTLGKPVPGKYRSSLLLGKPGSSASAQERWLITPQVLFASEAILPSQTVTAREYDRPRVYFAALAYAAVWAVLVVVCFKSGSRRTADREQSGEKENSG